MANGKLRPRWQAQNGLILEWDYQHGTIEAYDRRGHHLGEYDFFTGHMLKGPVAGRRIVP
jgi:putative cytotoxic protein